MNHNTRQKLDLLYELIRTNFKLRYNDSILGVVWVVLKPLLSFLVLFFVFANFKSNLGGSIETFQVYLLTGIVFYGYFSEGILSGMNSLLGMAHIILKVQFPRQLAVLSAQGLALINFLITLIILFVIASRNPIHPTFLSMMYFAYLVMVLTAFNYALSIYLSVATVKLRDLKNIFEILLQLGFYTSPIFYSIELIPENARAIYMMNPITIVIQGARSALINGQVLYVNSATVVLIISVLLILLGQIYFNKTVKRVAEYY